MKKKVIGLMSGTSLDGVDAALVEINEKKEQIDCELLKFISKTYTEKFRKKILKCTQKTVNVEAISQLNIKLAEKFSETIFELIASTSLELEQINLIGSHGQTICHDVNDTDLQSTFQIGSGSWIAEKTGITTVCNFRMRDLAAGGEGAPLIPYVDYLLYTAQKKNRILQNIGGISNYTYLPAAGKLNKVTGSDTGPGNMMIDFAVEILSEGELDYDHDGQWAARGEISDNLLAFMMNHPFLKKIPPKSTGRKDFGKDYVYKVIEKGKQLSLDKKDITASLTAFTAKSIVEAYKRFLPSAIDEIIISGGGSYNPVLVEFIKKYVNDKLSGHIEVITQEDLGYNSDAKEAIGFAILAYQTIKGRKNNIPQATGAEKKVVLGEIIPGKNFKNLF